MAHILIITNLSSSTQEIERFQQQGFQPKRLLIKFKRPILKENKEVLVKDENFFKADR